MLAKVENPNRLVVQHNGFLNGQFYMTTNELRIFVYMLSEIKKGDGEFREIRIPCAILQSDNRRVHYDDLREACDRLTKKNIGIEVTNAKGKRKFTYLPLMQICEHQEGSGTLVAEFNNRMKPYLLNLTENFTASQLKNFLNIKSYYSYRIYWLLKQYEDFKTRTLTIEELKEMLGIEDKYNHFGHFRTRVLNKAQKELKKTDIQFTYKTINVGRKVGKIKFEIVREKQLEESAKKADLNPQIAIFPDSEPEVDKSTALLQKLGFSRPEVKKVKEAVPQKKLFQILYRLEVDMPELISRQYDLKEETLLRLKDFLACDN
ncbi:MAG: replication initiation protein [Cyclobacteriaceae bacterium]